MALCPTGRERIVLNPEGRDAVLADWLDMLGMSEQGQRFAENRIDFSVLPDLTDQDLEKLGVVPGDRRKMLRAIAKRSPRRWRRCRH